MPDHHHHIVNEEDSIKNLLACASNRHDLERLSNIFSTMSPFSTPTYDSCSTQSSPMLLHRAASDYAFRSGSSSPGRPISPTTVLPSSSSSSSSSSYPIPTAPGLEHQHRRSRSVSDPDTEPDALFSVNRQIKSLLTELLNTDEVRGSARLRAYVQARLMDAEKELKGERRRRSSEASSRGSIALASSIHSGLKLSI